MSITPLNIGGAANDGNGQDLRSGGQVINDNFDELDRRTTAAQSTADAAQPKQAGKGLSANDFNNTLKAKLDGVAVGATANSSDAALVNRGNHTGTQLASTISNFAASVRDTLLAGIVFTNVTAVLATDSILVAIGKLQAKINTLGTAAFAVLVSSNVDGTVGRVLTVGAHGLGGLLPGVTGITLDDLRTSGRYYCTTAGGQGSLPVNSNGYVDSMVYAATYAIQTYTNVTTGQQYLRLLLNGTWQAWVTVPKASDFGSASALTATASTTDFTPGRALKVGDFGIGSNNVPQIADFGDDIRPGIYYGYGAQHAQATPNAPAGSGGGALAVLGLQGINSANYKSFIACSQASTTDADMFFGSRVSAAPPTWKRMLSLENCTRDPSLGTGGIISTTVVSGFTITKFIGGLLLIQGIDPGTASVAANAILTVNTTIPSVVANLTLTNVLVSAVPSSTNDFGGTTNALMTTGTNLRYTIKNGATAQTFTPRITIFSRWQ